VFEKQHWGQRWNDSMRYVCRCVLCVPAPTCLVHRGAEARQFFKRCNNASTCCPLQAAQHNSTCSTDCCLLRFCCHRGH
jgi:hypothetical protein